MSFMENVTKFLATVKADEEAVKSFALKAGVEILKVMPLVEELSAFWYPQAVPIEKAIEVSINGLENAHTAAQAPGADPKAILDQLLKDYVGVRASLASAPATP